MISACGLEPDLQILPDGDETEVTRFLHYENLSISALPDPKLFFLYFLYPLTPSCPQLIRKISFDNPKYGLDTGILLYIIRLYNRRNDTRHFGGFTG